LNSHQLAVYSHQLIILKKIIEMIKNSLTYEKAFNFAIRVVRAYQFLPNEKK
jgi:hypothetical protein